MIDDEKETNKKQVLTMELAISPKFENMCRTCMSISNEGETLRSVYDCVEDSQIAKMHIYEILESSVYQLPRIDRTDELPKTICNNCFTKLSDTYKFQQMSLCSDNQFRKLIAVNCNDIFSSESQVMLDPLQEVNSKELNLAEVDRFIKQESLEVVLQVENDGDCAGNCVQSTEIESQEFISTKNETSSEDKKAESTPTCKFCEKTFSISKYLRRHEKRMHSNELEVDIEKPHEPKNDKLYKCTECGSTFGKKVYLRKHKYRHKKIEKGLKKSHKCNSCDMDFLTIYSLKKHVLCAHQDLSNSTNIIDIKKPYVCEYCNKAFKQSCTLKEHKRIHTKETPFLCSDCGKAFHSNSNLQQHLLRHTGVKKYECPDCPKKFPCLSDLFSHKQVHKKLRPHICGECGAAFAKPSQLKKHNMYHSGEKPFQCEYCEMRFVCADHMRRHMRTHTGEKPYKCRYCPRTFTQSNDMIKHLRIHVGANVYQCELCPSAFRLAAELRDHFALHKNDDEETRERNKIALMEAQENLRIKMELDREISVAEANN